MKGWCKIVFPSRVLSTFGYWLVDRSYQDFIASSKCLVVAMGMEFCGSHITLEIYGRVFAKEYRLVFLQYPCFDEGFVLLKDIS